MRETEGNAVGTRKRQSGHSGRWKTDGEIDAQNSNDRLCLIPKSMFYVQTL